MGFSVPFSLNLDITDQCNFKCITCNVWKKENKVDLNYGIFNDQIKNSKILRKIKIFSIGGGEPFLKIDLLKKIINSIIKYSEPIQIRIVTNGFFSEEILNFTQYYFEKYKVPLGLKISLDGMKETHDQMRGKEGAYNLIISTIKKLNEIQNQNHKPINLSITLGFTDTHKNIDDLNEIYKLSKILNVKLFHKPFIQGGKFLNSNSDSSKDLLLNKDEDFAKIEKINNLLIDDLKKNKTLKYFEKIPTIKFYRAYNQYLNQDLSNMKCYAGKSSFFITPDGQVTTCLSLNDSYGNINETSFDEIWKNDLLKKFRKQKKECFCLTPCDTIPFLIVQKFPFYFPL